jgi:hypothetical protein
LGKIREKMDFLKVYVSMSFGRERSKLTRENRRKLSERDWL